MALEKLFNRRIFFVFVLLFIFTALALPQEERVKLEKVGVLDTKAYYFDLESGEFAYRAAGLEGISIFNIKDKAHPIKIIDFPVPGDVNYVKAVGQYLYASTDTDFYIIDISNPYSPVLKSSVAHGIKIMRFDISGNYAYLCHYISIYSFTFNLIVLTVVDISNPSSPRIMGHFEVEGNEIGSGDRVVYVATNNCIIAGNYALVSVFLDYSTRVKSSIYIIDLSNPTAPKLTANYVAESSRDQGLIPFINDIAVSGSYVFLANSNEGLQVLDFSNPFLPQLVNQNDSVKDILQLKQTGHYLLALRHDALLIYDIANPRAPVQVGSRPFTDLLVSMDVAGNRVSLVTDREKHIILDISSPSNPTVLIERIPQSPNDRIEAFSGHYGYIVDKEGGFKIIDISSPEKPVILSEYHPAGEPGFLGISGDMVFTFEGSKFNIIDISNKSNPVLVGSLNTYLNNYIGISGNYVFLRNIRTIDLYNLGDLGIVDISDKTNPRLISTLKNIFLGQEVLDGDSLYICSNIVSMTAHGYVEAIDVSNKSNPVQKGKISLPQYIYDVKVFGNYVYAFTDDSKMHIINFTDKSNPVEIGTPLRITINSSINISGNYLYSNGTDSIQTFDISDPSAPNLVATYNTELYLITGQISGHYLVVSSSRNYNDFRFYVFDLSDPLKLVLVGASDSILRKSVSDISSFFVKDNYIYLVGKDKVVVFRIKSNESPSLQVIYPNGNDVISTSSVIKIQWLANDLTGDVTIDLYKNGKFFQTIAKVPSELGSYSYQFPSNTPWSPDYRIRISQGNIEDFSDEDFYIYGAQKRPVYRFSENPVIFTTTPGVNPTPKSISIISDSGDSSSWTVETVQPWIHVTPSSGNGPGTFTVSVDVTGLTNGIYQGGVILNIPGGEDSRVYLGVTLSIFNSIPVLSLDKTNLILPVTRVDKYPEENVHIDFGTEPVSWFTSVDSELISVSPSHGIGTQVISVAFRPGITLPPGIYTAKITVSSPFASNSPQYITVTIDVKDEGFPFGEISSPKGGDDDSLSGSIAITGWALDNTGIDSVKIYGSQTGVKDPGARFFIGNAVFVENARPDVQAKYPDYPNSSRAGWGFLLLTQSLPSIINNVGDGDWTIYAIAKDLDGNEEMLEPVDINVSNEYSSKPFGTIDKPQQGEQIKGNAYWNFGWALTPQPNKIPEDGSTIDVIVDGVNTGHPIYSNYRPDVTERFPGYENSRYPGGYFYLDFTNLAEGLHTISWNVTDDAGNTDGIGSRYFSISRSSGSNDSVSSGGSLIGMKEEVLGTSTSSVRIDMKEMERLKIDLWEGLDRSEGNFVRLEGYSVIGNQLNKLPVGSTMDSVKGIFYWQPGPGFLGEYRLVFIGEDDQGQVMKKDIIVTIGPKYK